MTILGLVIVVESCLESDSLSESLGQALDFVGDLVHPDVVEGLLFFHDLLLDQLGEGFDLILFLNENQVFQCL